MPALPKEFIADTYRKLVNVHGRTIGHDLFVRETGITPYYWQGVYWPTWKAFQADAGFAPNEQKKKIPDEALLRELAELALRLEKLPRQQDLVRRKREDPSFPNNTAFHRLGPYPVRMARLAAYCEGKRKFAPVAAMLERRRYELLTRESRSTFRVLGFVYLARRGKPETMTYEIGCEHAAGRQLQGLAARRSRLPGTIHLIDTDDPEGVRRYWCTRFRSRRRGGRYFRLFPEDVLAFRWRRFQ